MRLVLNLNSIIRLKILKLFIKNFFYLLNKNNNIILLRFYFYFFFKIKNIFNNYNINFNNKLYLLLKKINYFKINYLNSYVFYKFFNFNINLNRDLNIENISNYNIKYLFFYYYFYIQNVKLGMIKYFNNFYQNNLFFIKFFILKYLKSFFKFKNLYFNIQKNNLIINDKKSLYKILLKKVKYLNFLKEIRFKLKSFINLVLISLYSKDMILLKNGIKNILERLHFKKHRRFLYNLKILIKFLSYIFFLKFKCLGLYIKVKGKIGVGGNLKKRKFIFKIGSFSFTKKLQKLNYIKDSIRTYSGVLGLEIYLIYK